MEPLPGQPFSLGATPRDGGTNFAVMSDLARGLLLCLFDDDGPRRRSRCRIAMPTCGTAFVPGVAPGSVRLSRARPVRSGPRARCNPHKLLLDPYAKATSGNVWFGPCLATSSTIQTAEHARLGRPRAAQPGRRPELHVADRPFAPRTYADTIIYEVHVKGFTMAHPESRRAARHVRRPGRPGGHPASGRSGYHRRRALASPPVAFPRVSGRIGTDQLLGLQLDRLFRAA